MVDEANAGAKHHVYDKSGEYQESFHDARSAEEQAEMLKGSVVFGGQEQWVDGQLRHLGGRVAYQAEQDDPLAAFKGMSPEDRAKVAEKVGLSSDALARINAEIERQAEEAANQPEPTPVPEPEPAPVEKAKPTAKTDPMADHLLAPMTKQAIALSEKMGHTSL